MNTFGFHSINAATFNTQWGSNLAYPRDSRNVVYSAFKVNNLAFNILGYIPGVSVVSGSIRMVIGVAIVIGTLCVGDPNAKRGAIIGPWYWEALATGVSQIARGALEAFVPYGQFVNLGLDIVATPWNSIRSLTWDDRGCGDMEPGGVGPYDKPDYPLLLKPLHLV